MITDPPMKSKQKLFGLFTGLYLAVFGIENVDAYYEKPNFEKPKYLTIEEILMKKEVKGNRFPICNKKSEDEISAEGYNVKREFCNQGNYFIIKYIISEKTLGYAIFKKIDNGTIMPEKAFIQKEENNFEEADFSNGFYIPDWIK